MVVGTGGSWYWWQWVCTILVVVCTGSWYFGVGTGWGWYWWQWVYTGGSWLGLVLVAVGTLGLGE